MEAVRRILRNEGLIRLYIDKDRAILQRYNKKVQFKYTPETAPPELKNLLEKFKGTHPYKIHSDIFEPDALTFEFKPMEKHTMHRLIEEILSATLPYLSKISHDEKTPLLVNIEMNQEHPAIRIEAGLENDLLITLIEISQGNEEDHDKPMHTGR